MEKRIDDIRLALLGDKAAQDRMTERGELLPCPCGGHASIRYTGCPSGPLGYTCNVYKRSNPGFVMCNKCGLMTQKKSRLCRAVKDWNTRAPILTPEELEKLEESL